MTQPVDLPADPILARLAARHSVRAFAPRPLEATLIDAVIADGLNAPNACNHQLWHFVVVRDPGTRQRLQAISGSNEHFVTADAVILLCFHMGWNHNKFAVVQSVAAAAYHMCLSAHLRGLGAVWNAGIGNGQKIRALVDLPAGFEVIGCLCLGYPAEAVAEVKPPRRPLDTVRSFERFKRPAEAVYPLRPAKQYRYWDLMNHANRYSVFDPAVWGWERIADFRSYAVYAKSPLPGTYVSRRLGKEMAVEVGLLGPLAPGARLLEVMPFGGAYTALLLRTYPQLGELLVAELSPRNLDFVRLRVANEGLPTDRLVPLVMDGPRLPVADASVDAVVLPQILEGVPEPAALLAEVRRVLKPNGRVVITLRNAWSWFGLHYRLSIATGQVPNFGPYRPITPWQLSAWTANAGFETQSRLGISPLPSRIGQVWRGLGAPVCRLLAVTLTAR